MGPAVVDAYLKNYCDKTLHHIHLTGVKEENLMRAKLAVDFYTEVNFLYQG